MGPRDQARERMPGSGGGTRRQLGQRGDSRAWNAAGIQAGSRGLPGLEGAGVPAVGSAVCGWTSRMFWGGRGQRGRSLPWLRKEQVLELGILLMSILGMPNIRLRGIPQRCGKDRA